MLAKLIVMEWQDYDRWAAGGAGGPAGETMSARGDRVMKSAGCLNCHAIEGKEKIGPNFKGLFGSTRPLEGGASAAADEEYLRESIVDPGAKIAKGHPNVMPTFKTTLSPEDVSAIVQRLKELK